MATAVNGWLLAYDNISEIPRWLSDALCQLVFGAGFAGRALFTNDERSVIYAQRPVLLSGIDDFVPLGDLKDRCVFLHLPPIPRRQPPRRGRVLEGVSRRPSADPGRRARRDRGRTARAAVGPSRGIAAHGRLRQVGRSGRPRHWDGEPRRFCPTYNDNRKEATEPEIEGSPIGTLMLWTARRTANWSGTPAGLLDKLTGLISKKEAASARWPKTPREPLQRATAHRSPTRSAWPDRGVR